MKTQICVVIFLWLSVLQTMAVYAAAVNEIDTPTALGNILIRLSGERPAVNIMDNLKLSSLSKYWDHIKTYKDMGRTFFLYKGFLETHKNKSQVKPNPVRTNYRYNIAFGWTFVCFLDLHQSDSRDAYLYKLLSMGNGRTDNFLFIGESGLLQPVLGNPLMRKFRNVIGIETSGVVLVTHYRQTCKKSEVGNGFFATANIALPTWIPRNENCLAGHHFRVSGTDFPPFMYYLRPEDSETCDWEYNGVNYRILQNGGERYNFTIVLNHPTKWKLMGEKLANGTWDGIFGDLVYGRAEIASVSNPSGDRQGLADFIGPFGRSNLVFMSVNPVTYADAGEYAIMYPFPLFCWAVLLGGFLLVWGLNSIALKVRHKMGQKKYASHGRDSVMRAFMMVMAFTFEQEIGKPKGLPLRLLMIVWVSFMVIMGTSYKYNLASYIVTPRPDTVPRTFEDLYYRPEYKILFDLGGISGYNFFKTNPDKKIKALVKRTEPTEDTSACTVTAFQEISTVCAGWDFSLEFASSRNLSITLGQPALYKSEALFDAWFVFAIENNSVFTKEFMKIGRAYFENGVVGMWEDAIIRVEQYRGRKWLSERKHTHLYEQLLAFQTRSSRTILEKLDFKNVKFIFMIFGIGILLSCIVFLIELFYDNEKIKRMFQRKKMKVRKISRVVMRKISGEMVVPSSSLDMRNERKMQQQHSGLDKPSITVTFLP